MSVAADGALTRVTIAKIEEDVYKRCVAAEACKISMNPVQRLQEASWAVAQVACILHTNLARHRAGLVKSIYSSTGMDPVWTPRAFNDTVVKPQ